MWRHVLVCIAGVYFIVAPWWTGTAAQRTPTVVSVLVGLALAGVFGLMVARRETDRAGLWFGVVAGLWFVLHPFLGHFEIPSYWGYVAPALVVIALSLWSLMRITQVSER
ncbi:MAG: SPW repeat protein [Thermoflavifilum sp.]|nr:SPW repeat protein [Thermoflavifilum sp.]MCL6514608.1 SPW repeat protein [Alicyclobacillus sp.]